MAAKKGGNGDSRNLIVLCWNYMGVVVRTNENEPVVRNSAVAAAL